MNGREFKNTVFVIILAATAIVASAQTSGQDGVGLYNGGNFAGAESALQTVLGSSGIDGEVLYNLGLATYKAGKIGESVAAFHAASLILKGDADAEANLKFVTSKIQDKIEWSDGGSVWAQLLFWTNLMSVTKQWWLAFVLGIVGLVLAAFLPWAKPNIRLQAGAVALAASSLSVVLTAGLCFQWQQHNHAGAVIIAELPVWSAPTKEAGEKLFLLHEGVPLLRLQDSGVWSQIRMLDGRTGWVEHSGIRTYATVLQE
jgi:hypothetical protein